MGYDVVEYYLVHFADGGDRGGDMCDEEGGGVNYDAPGELACFCTTDGWVRGKPHV